MAMFFAPDSIGVRRVLWLRMASCLLALLLCCGVSAVQSQDGRIETRPPTGPPPAERAVFFPSDGLIPRRTSLAVIEQHAQYLIRHPAAQVRLEGHTDERDSREYNLARGQRRANEVMKRLIELGAGESQITALSLGEERPVDKGHTESAWSRNRRVDFIYRGMNE